MESVLDFENFQIEGMREGMAGLVVERDFYFDKLRKIELLCQEAEKSLSVSRKEVLDILYETQVRLLD